MSRYKLMFDEKRARAPGIGFVMTGDLDRANKLKEKLKVYYHDNLEKGPRGISKPWGFSFNLLKDKHGVKRGMLVHSVMFNSYEAGEEATVDLADPDGDDPRMRAFIRYCLDNWMAEADQRLPILKEELTRLYKEIDRLENIIKEQRTKVRPQ